MNKFNFQFAPPASGEDNSTYTTHELNTVVCIVLPLVHTSVQLLRKEHAPCNLFERARPYILGRYQEATNVSLTGKMGQETIITREVIAY